MVGFLISGFLSVVLTVEKISQYLGKQNFKSIFLASVFGVPIPLCSCGVIPVTAYLRKHGASKASATSFLISTPQTGIDSIMVTYGMLGPLMAIYRPIIAFLSGIVGGLLINATDVKKNEEVLSSSCGSDCCDDYDKNSKILSALHYGFIRLPIDIINPLVLGLILSAFISVFIEPGFFIDTIKLKIPVFGSLLDQSILNKFCKTFGILIGAGVPVLEAMALLRKVVGNRVYEKAVLDASNYIRDGYNISTALRRTEIFPSILLQLVSTGEETGEIDDLLDRAADYYHKQVNALVERMTTLIEPLLILLVGGVIALMVVLTYLPVFHLGSALQSGL